jgi:hypothetical protein
MDELKLCAGSPCATRTLDKAASLGRAGSPVCRAMSFSGLASLGPWLVVVALGLTACEPHLQGFEDLEEVYINNPEPDAAKDIDPVCDAQFCRTGAAFDAANCECCDRARTELTCVCVRNQFDPLCENPDDGGDAGDGTDTGTDDTAGTDGGPAPPKILGCASPTRPSGRFGCMIDRGDGKGFVDAPFCVPSAPSVKPGDFGYAACKDCSPGTPKPAVIPGKWRGNASLDATSKSLSGILDGSLELPIVLAFTHRDRDVEASAPISDARDLNSILCIDQPNLLSDPGQLFDGWSTYFDEATGDFRATISGLFVPARFRPDLLRDYVYADVLMEGRITSDQCMIGWVSLYLSNYLQCPVAIELIGPFFAGLAEFEPAEGPVYPGVPCLSYDTAKVPGPAATAGASDACPSAPAYKEIINGLDNPDTGGKGWPACEGKGFCK